MPDHSQENHALDQGWRPIAWTRDFDRFRATIVQQQDGRCMWRVQNLELPADAHAGHCESLAKANEAITRIAGANLIISGAPTIIR